jgi:hypothetical protein
VPVTPNPYLNQSVFEYPPVNTKYSTFEQFGGKPDPNLLIENKIPIKNLTSHFMANSSGFNDETANFHDDYL